jgi:hypothetical protein
VVEEERGDDGERGRRDERGLRARKLEGDLKNAWSGKRFESRWLRS